MNILRWIAGAVIGGALGAALWAAVTVYTNHEVGWIALGVGALCGFLVQKFSAPHTGSKVPGVIAAAVAVLAIVAGKYASAYIVIDRLFAVQEVALPESILITQVAGQLAMEREAKGEKLTWPDDDAQKDDDPATAFPEGIWAEAEKRWSEKSPEQKAEFRAELEREQAANDALIRVPIQEAAFEALKGSFTPMDLLFGFLAVSTAYRLGSQPVRPEEVTADPFKQDDGDPFKQ